MGFVIDTPSSPHNLRGSSSDPSGIRLHDADNQNQLRNLTNVFLVDFAVYTGVIITLCQSNNGILAYWVQQHSSVFTLLIPIAEVVHVALR